MNVSVKFEAGQRNDCSVHAVRRLLNKFAFQRGIESLVGALKSVDGSLSFRPGLKDRESDHGADVGKIDSAIRNCGLKIIIENFQPDHISAPIQIEMELILTNGDVAIKS